MAPVSMNTNLNDMYVNKVSRHERKTDEKVFKDTQKMMKKSEVRNSDWGLEAAQNCLARDLVNCDADELRLITAKMDYIQSKINNNLTADNDFKNSYIRTKAEIIPRKTEAAKAYAQMAKDIINSSSEMVTAIKPSDPATELVKVLRHLDPSFNLLNVLKSSDYAKDGQKNIDLAA